MLIVLKHIRLLRRSRHRQDRVSEKGKLLKVQEVVPAKTSRTKISEVLKELETITEEQIKKQNKLDEESGKGNPPDILRREARAHGLGNFNPFSRTQSSEGVESAAFLHHTHPCIYHTVKWMH